MTPAHEIIQEKEKLQKKIEEVCKNFVSDAANNFRGKTGVPINEISFRFLYNEAWHLGEEKLKLLPTGIEVKIETMHII